VRTTWIRLATISTAQLFLAASGALAASKLSVSPTSASVFPTQTSFNFTVAISYPPSTGAGSSTLQLTGLPAGVSAEPAPAYSFAKNSTFSQIIFHFATSAQTPPGTYSITIHDPPNAQKDSGGIATVVLTVKTPSFQGSASPNPVALVAFGPAQSVSVTTATDPGFSAPITYAFSGFPAFVVFSGAQTVGPPYAPLSFSFAAGPGSVPGTYAGTLAGTSGPTTKSSPFSVQVTSPPAPLLTAVTPSTAPAGSALSVVLSGTNFLPGATVLVSGGDVAVSAVVITSPTQISVTFTISATAPPGARPVTVRNPDGQISNALPFTVVLPPAPALTAITPATIVEGSSSSVILSGTNFQEGAAVLVSGGGVSVSGVAVIGSSQISLTLAATPTATPGSRSVTVRNPDGQVSNSLSLAVVAPSGSPPQVASLSPSRAAAGARSLSLVIAGSNFKPGAVLTTSSSFLSISEASFVSASELHGVVSVSGDAPPGPVGIGVRNPDGLVSPTVAPLLVFPEGAIGAPVGITTAAVVFPVEGAAIAQGEAVYPRGLLATAGTGTVRGSWLFDGFPFDRFVATVTAGQPMEVQSHVPMPFSFAGGHRIAIAIESPQRLESPAVGIVAIADGGTSFRALLPSDGTILGRASPRFSWTMAPGASGYRIEIQSASGVFRNWRTADSAWQPGSGDLAALGSGALQWRVRPIFPVDVEGEPTPWRRLVVIPERITLGVPAVEHDNATGRTVVRWSGGSPGLVYYLEFLDRDGRVVYSALIVRPEYVLPRDRESTLGLLRRRVSAYGPEKEVLGRSNVSGGPGGAARRATAGDWTTVQSAPQVTRMEPGQGETVATTTPRIAAAWTSAVSPGELVLLVDGTDVVGLASLTPVSVDYVAFFPLDPGSHAVKLSLAGIERAWSFTVRQGATAVSPPPSLTAAPGGAALAGGTLPPKPGAWGLVATGIGTVLSGDRADQADAARLVFSGQGDLRSGALAGKYSGDVSFRHDIEDPHATVQESRNWVSSASAGSENLQLEARAGYTTPTFLDQATLVTTGLARGAVEGKLKTPVGIASVYQSFASAPSGTVSGTSGSSQKIEAAAIQSPSSFPIDLRAVALEARDERGDLTSGGRGTLIGGFAHVTLGAGLSLTAEGAHGRFEPHSQDAPRPAREGSAWRVRASGIVASTVYDLSVHSASDGFVNPANPGLTASAIPMRVGGEFLLSRSLGKLSLGTQLRYEKGKASDAGPGEASEKGGMVMATLPLAQTIALSLLGSLTRDSGDAAPGSAFPKVDRRQTSVTGTLTETPGKVAFSESYSDLRLTDDVDASLSSRTRTALVSATGSLLPDFNLSAIVSGTRSESGLSGGNTDLWLVALQPSVAIKPIGVSIAPSASYNRSEDKSSGSRSTSEQYRALVIYAPLHLGSLLSIQLSGEWNRTRTSAPSISGAPAGFDHRYAAALLLRWGAGPLGSAPPVSTLPGASPLAPKERTPPGKGTSPFGSVNANGTAPPGTGAPWP